MCKYNILRDLFYFDTNHHGDWEDQNLYGRLETQGRVHVAAEV